ncbi:MAG: hypothetical protein JWN46_642 [Acidimicrobiales bacterium]|nr:hypothetical protein [Acidimicrobiales bacterium]
MRRDQLEHLLRAAAQITGVVDLVVIGSQAILGSFADYQLPISATRSTEADIAVDLIVAGRSPDDRAEADLADEVDGAIGEHSAFHREFGYYAQGVESITATVTVGWRDRLVPVIVEGVDAPVAVGWCLERHDLWVSKAAASRPKDHEFCTALAVAGLVDREECAQRIALLSVADRRRAEVTFSRSFAQ